MTTFKKLNLQLFAGEGAGGEGAGAEGAATGETPAAAGQDQRLLELGVPAEVLKKRANRKGARQQVIATPAQAAPPAEQAASAETQPTTEETVPEPQRLTWDQIMADPEYNKQMQSTIQSRLKGAKVAEANMGKLAPALEVLARKYGQDPANIDFDALSQAINDDEQFYEDKALEYGTDVQNARRIDQLERDAERQRRAEEQTLEQQRIAQHFQSMEQQGEVLRQTFPDFDLRTELQNPAFARMVHPNVGVSVEDAYYAVHRKEIQAASMQVAAQRAAQKISNAVQSGSRRPVENGTTAKAPSEVTFDWHNATPEQRAEMKQRIRQAAARGEKVYPGR